MTIEKKTKIFFIGYGLLFVIMFLVTFDYDAFFKEWEHNQYIRPVIELSNDIYSKFVFQVDGKQYRVKVDDWKEGVLIHDTDDSNVKNVHIVLMIYEVDKEEEYQTFSFQRVNAIKKDDEFYLLNNDDREMDYLMKSLLSDFVDWYLSPIVPMRSVVEDELVYTFKFDEYYKQIRPGELNYYCNDTFFRTYVDGDVDFEKEKFIMKVTYEKKLPEVPLPGVK